MKRDRDRDSVSEKEEGKERVSGLEGKAVIKWTWEKQKKEEAK